MNRKKYPRTFHLPFSPGCTSDDKVLRSLDCFKGREVVITEKMDGENTTLYRDGFHARSIDGRHHPSRNWLAGFHATIAHDIPDGWRICGENLYAQHSLAYQGLPSYFMAFSVWDENDRALSWDATLETLDLLAVATPPSLYRGSFEEIDLEKFAYKFDTHLHEGFVVRLADSFAVEDFSKSVAKWVRANHVQTDDHWMHSEIKPNGLAT